MVCLRNICINTLHKVDDDDDDDDDGDDDNDNNNNNSNKSYRISETCLKIPSYYIPIF